METSSPAASSKADVPTFSGEVGFTPGPWKASQHPYGAKPWVVNGPDRHPIAGSIGRNENAFLIEASPNLYAALAEIAGATVTTDSGANAHTIWRLRNIARDALSQVRGE